MPKRPNQYEPVTVNLRKETIKKIDEIVKLERRNKTELLRNIIEDGVKGRGKE